MLNSGSRPAACQVDPDVILALNKDNIVPSLFRKMIQRADTNTTTNDNNACMRFHRDTSTITVPFKAWHGQPRGDAVARPLW